MNDYNHSIERYRRNTAKIREKELIDTNKKAKDAGLTYGKFVAQQYLKTHRIDQCV